MKLHPDSHLDHDLTARQLAHILQRFADRSAFFIETITLPEDLGTVPCALVGPATGAAPPPTDQVVLQKRGDRAWQSRIVFVWTMPRTRELTVIAGPHDGQPCVLFTAYGGPPAPPEPGDIRAQLEKLEAERREQPRVYLMGYPDALSDEQLSNADPLYAKILDLRTKRDEADAFWAEHALAVVKDA